MKKNRSILTSSVLCLVLVLSPSYSFAKKKELPDTTHDGLERVDKPESGADVVYLLPDVDLSGYKKIAVLEPYIAFRDGWLSYQNSTRHMANRLSSRDVERMIEKGTDFFMDAFTEALEERGYPVVRTREPDVLIVRPAVINVELAYADPDNLGGIWNKVYTDGWGQATLYVEFFDSITGQILGRAIDREWDDGGGYSWRIPRSQSSNKNDIRAAINMWAKMIANGLDRIKLEESKAK